MIIAPSILSADFVRLGAEVQAVLDAGADWIHVDVMDGQFVPNITMGPLVVQAVRRNFECFLDVHLMIQNPERYIDAFADAGADSITVHAEATPHVHRALQQIRNRGCRVGLALNPATGLDILNQVAGDIDLLLVMTVNPGFGGQSLIPATLDKVKRARTWFDETGLNRVLIEVDGGVNPVTASSVASAGANVCVAGSAVFSSSDYHHAIAALREAATQLGNAEDST